MRLARPCAASLSSSPPQTPGERLCARSCPPCLPALRRCTSRLTATVMRWQSTRPPARRSSLSTHWRGCVTGRLGALRRLVPRMTWPKGCAAGLQGCRDAAAAVLPALCVLRFLLLLGILLKASGLWAFAAAIQPASPSSLCGLASPAPLPSIVQRAIRTRHSPSSALPRPPLHALTGACGWALLLRRHCSGTDLQLC